MAATQVIAGDGLSLAMKAPIWSKSFGVRVPEKSLPTLCSRQPFGGPAPKVIFHSQLSQEGSIGRIRSGHHTA